MKKLIIVLVIVVIAAAAGWWFYKTSRKQTNKEEPRTKDKEIILVDEVVESPEPTTEEPTKKEPIKEPQPKVETKTAIPKEYNYSAANPKTEKILAPTNNSPMGKLAAKVYWTKSSFLNGEKWYEELYDQNNKLLARKWAGVVKNGKFTGIPKEQQYTKELPLVSKMPIPSKPGRLMTIKQYLDDNLKWWVEKYDENNKLISRENTAGIIISGA